MYSKKYKLSYKKNYSTKVGYKLKIGYLPVMVYIQHPSLILKEWMLFLDNSRQKIASSKYYCNFFICFKIKQK